MTSRVGLGSLALILLMAGCSSDPTTSDEYVELEAQLAAVTAERDALLTDSQATASRYERAKATQDTIGAIMADPTAYGTETEVLDMLDTFTAPGVVSGDLAFGGTMTGIWRSGWRNTLYGEVAGNIRTWLADDGSVGGSLWSWSGTAGNGEPFEIQGVEISRFSDDGLYEELIMFYPYEDAEVRRRFAEGN
jgi:outer membrane murein-binding lipoprotein Lpp